MDCRRRYRGRKYIRLMTTEDGYRMVLRSMVGWLEKNLDPHKTRIFFMSMSPTHFRQAINFFLVLIIFGFIIVCYG